MAHPRVFFSIPHFASSYDPPAIVRPHPQCHYLYPSSVSHTTKLHLNLTGHVQLFQTRAQSQSAEQNRSTGFPFSAALCGTFVICCQRLAWIILLSTPNLDCMIMLNGKTRETQPTNDIITPLALVVSLWTPGPSSFHLLTI